MFFLLTFAWSWALWWAATRVDGGATTGAGAALVLAGVVGPAVWALVFTARERGTAGLSELAGRIVRPPRHSTDVLIAVGFMLSLKLAAALAIRAATGAWPTFGDTPILVMLAGTIVSTPMQAGEEVGWRGYALPRLTRSLGLGGAALALGVIWALWHLPHFFMEGASLFGQSLPLYVLQVTALSVVIAWLYWRSGGSLLTVMLLHAAINNTKDIVPSASLAAGSPFTFSASTVGWTTCALAWIAAAACLVAMRGKALED